MGLLTSSPLSSIAVTPFILYYYCDYILIKRIFLFLSFRLFYIFWRTNFYTFSVRFLKIFLFCFGFAVYLHVFVCVHSRCLYFFFSFNSISFFFNLYYLKHLLYHRLFTVHARYYSKNTH